MYIKKDEIFNLAYNNTYNKDDFASIITLNDMYVDFLSNNKTKQEEGYLLKIIEKVYWKSMDQMKDSIITNAIEVKGSIDFVLKFKQSTESSSSFIISNLIYKNIFSDNQVINIKDINKRKIRRKIKNSTILITDDFIGSGKTVIKVLKKFKKNLGINFVAVAHISTKIGKKSIEDYVNKNKKIRSIRFNKDIFIANSYKDIFRDEKIIKYIEEVCSLCKNKKYKFGFKNGGTLLSLDQRSPNNNISMLWLDEYDSPRNSWIPLINRDFTIKEIMTTKKKMFNNYKDIIFEKYSRLKDKEINLNEFIILFLLRTNTSLSLNDIRVLSGINSKKSFNTLVEGLVSKGYILSLEQPEIISQDMIVILSEISRLILRGSINALSDYKKKPNKDFISSKYIVKYI